MENRDGAFIARPEHERCQAGFTGCTGERSIRIHCNVEGADLMACNSCVGRWRMLAVNPEYQDRCPRCSRHPRPVWMPRPPLVAPDYGIPLTGAIADAVDQAMHASGITIDVRRQVLGRLAIDHSWMGEVSRPMVDVCKEIIRQQSAAPRRVLLCLPGQRSRCPWPRPLTG